MDSNPDEVLKFFRVNLQLHKLQLPLRRSYFHLNFYLHGSHHLHSIFSNLLIQLLLFIYFSYLSTKIAGRALCKIPFLMLKC